MSAPGMKIKVRMTVSLTHHLISLSLCGQLTVQYVRSDLHALIALHGHRLNIL